MKNTRLVIILGAAGVVVIGVVLYLIFHRPDLSGSIVIPYIAHQKPAIDPHLPGPTPLSDKLDEVQFDGLFDLSANPSGVVYRDGLGELVGVDQDNVVTVHLKQNKRWSDSYQIVAKDDQYTITSGRDHFFSAADLQFTIRRIMTLGSLSPDYILLIQAMESPGFEGPDDKGNIRFRFRQNRIWKEADIKESLSFKIIPDGSAMNALNYTVGTAAYMPLPPKDGVSNYARTPDGGATIPSVVLAPFIDNSTYTTELRNNSINVLLETPHGALSPILADGRKFFTKSNISTVMFAVLFNTSRLSRDARVQVRRLLESRTIADRFFNVGTPQQRHIVDYKGNRDNYADYVNRSVFPSSSYYIDEKVVEPVPDDAPPDMSLLPDTVRIKACANYGFREEYSDLVDILNDPQVTRGKVKATVVGNDEIQRTNYDAVLVAFSGYRSNFLFDLYDIVLRQPDLQTYRINLETSEDAKGVQTVSPSSLRSGNNFFSLDASAETPDRADVNQFLQYVYGFMSTRNIGDKQEYARRIDGLEHGLCLGAWLFSVPSLAYFSTQFDSTSISLYGVASQLSTIGQWRESPER
ncbi:MAG TPA: hypothetical protein VL221_00585 [Bacteroidota bacterium]|nr:hypothetical protein [Bacteroidota bacterium]